MGIESNVAGTVRALVATAVAAMALGGVAQAACTDPSWATAGGSFKPTVYRPGSDGAFMQVSDSAPAVVGLWKFEWLAKSLGGNKNPMPDGVLIDFGTAAWHSDGTELMNSGIRNPADGDFCQGAWRQTGESTYFLNHYALAYQGGSYVGPANIRLQVNVAGNRMSGVFKLVQYLASTTPGHEFDQTTPLVTITGTVSGTRVTAN